MILPAVVQLSVFLPSSWFLAHLATDPFSAFDSESFLSLTRLSSEDESLGFPIALGLVTMANVESSTWFMTADEREALRVQEAKRQEQGVFTLPVGKIIRFALRSVSVVRIVIASQVSGVRSSPLHLIQKFINTLGCRDLLGYLCGVWFVTDVVDGVHETHTTQRCSPAKSIFHPRA